VGETQEEVDAERQARSKAEKQRADLKRELDELCERLEEAGGASAAQAEVNRRREAELGQLRLQLEQAGVQSEGALAALRKRSQEAVAEAAAQVDALNKLKNK
jgi:DNA-binding ferritin-like protein